MNESDMIRLTKKVKRSHMNMNTYPQQPNESYELCKPNRKHSSSSSEFISHGVNKFRSESLHGKLNSFFTVLQPAAIFLSYKLYIEYVFTVNLYTQFIFTPPM